MAYERTFSVVRFCITSHGLFCLVFEWKEALSSYVTNKNRGHRGEIYAVLAKTNTGQK